MAIGLHYWMDAGTRSARRSLSLGDLADDSSKLLGPSTLVGREASCYAPVEAEAEEPALQGSAVPAAPAPTPEYTASIFGASAVCVGEGWRLRERIRLCEPGFSLTGRCEEDAHLASS
jgi:hypothetical protein